jgi:hypothetical protein
MIKTAVPPLSLFSSTPDLEGAPCSALHENRSKSVISSPKTSSGREEGAPSKR